MRRQAAAVRFKDRDVSDEARGIRPDVLRSPRRAHGGSAAPYPGDLGGRCLDGRRGLVLPEAPPLASPPMRPAIAEP